MAQIIQGGAIVTQGSNRVIAADGANWASAAPGDLFSVAQGGLFYQIASVVHPDVSESEEWELLLTHNFAQDVGSEPVNYVIHSDFTPHIGLPLVRRGDVETASILRRAMMLLDQTVAAIGGTSDANFIDDVVSENGQIPLKALPPQAYLSAFRVAKIDGGEIEEFKIGRIAGGNDLFGPVNIPADAGEFYDALTIYRLTKPQTPIGSGNQPVYVSATNWNAASLRVTIHWLGIPNDVI